MSRHLTLLAASFFLCGTTDARAQIKLRFSGFGDFIAGYTGGSYADPQARGMFEAFGDDTDPVNTNRGFGLTGTDFLSHLGRVLLVAAQDQKAGQVIDSMGESGRLPP